MRAAALLVALALGAFDVGLDRAAIDNALAIGNSSVEATHRQFHADYRVEVNRPPVDFVSVVSPFRRAVLLAESEQRLGRRMFGQAEVLAAMRPDTTRVELYAELSFHPLNTFVRVPDYTVALEPVYVASPPVVPREIERLPRFGRRFDGTGTGWYPFPYPYPGGPQVPASSEPLLGGTLIARFAGEQLDPKGLYTVVVKDGKQELARARVDFARLR